MQDSTGSSPLNFIDFNNPFLLGGRFLKHELATRVGGVLSVGVTLLVNFGTFIGASGRIFIRIHSFDVVI